MIAERELIRHRAGHDAQVLAAHVVLLHLRGKARCGLARFGKDHQAADGAVETVYKADIHIAGLVVLHADILTQFGQDVRIAGMIGLREHIRRLDSHEDVVILVDNLRQLSHATTVRWRRRAARRRW